MTKQEWQYLKTIENKDNLLEKKDALISQFEAREVSTQKELAMLRKQQADDINQNNKLTNHINMLVKDLADKDALINYERQDLAEYKTYYNKVKDLERTLSNIESHNKSINSVKDLYIESMKKTNNELHARIDDLEERLSEYEDDTDEDEDDEPVSSQSDEEGLFPVASSKKQYGGLMDDSEDDDDKFIMPPDDVDLPLAEKKVEAALKLLDGGKLPMDMIEKLIEVKKELGGEVKVLPVPNEVELAQAAIKAELQKNNGTVKESFLLRLKSVVWDTSKITKMCRIGSDMVLKRNFLSDNYEIVKK